MNKWKRAVLWTVLVISAGYIVYTLAYKELGISSVDESDYQAVAEHFIQNNAIIARELGRVSRVSQVGDGGGASVSHNVFRVTGTELSGVCYISLSRDNDNTWYVSKALLSVEGRDLKLPVRGAGKGRKIKVFG